MYTTNIFQLSKQQTKLFKTILQLSENELIGQLENNSHIVFGLTVSDLCIARLVFEFYIDAPILNEGTKDMLTIYDSNNDKHTIEVYKKITKDQKKKLMRFLQNTIYHYNIQQLIQSRQNTNNPNLDNRILKSKPVSMLHLKLNEHEIHLTNNELLDLLDHIDKEHINHYLLHENLFFDHDDVYSLTKNASIHGSEVSARILSQHYLNRLVNENEQFLISISRLLENNTSELLAFTAFLSEHGISIGS